MNVSRPRGLSLLPAAINNYDNNQTVRRRSWPCLVAETANTARTVPPKDKHGTSSHHPNPGNRMHPIQPLIEEAFENVLKSPGHHQPGAEGDRSSDHRAGSGPSACCGKIDGEWVTHQWVKKPCCCRSAPMTTNRWLAAAPSITTRCRTSLPT